MLSEPLMQEGGWKVPPQQVKNNIPRINKPAPAPAPAAAAGKPPVPAAAALGDAKHVAPGKSKSAKKPKSKTPSKHSKHSKSNAPPIQQPSRHNLLSILVGGNAVQPSELHDLLLNLR